MQSQVTLKESNEFLRDQATILSNIASEAAGHGSEGFQLNKRPFCNAFTGEPEIHPTTFTVSFNDTLETVV